MHSTTTMRRCRRIGSSDQAANASLPPRTGSNTSPGPSAGMETVTRPTLPRMLSSPSADTFHRLSHDSCHFLVYTCAEGLRYARPRPARSPRPAAPRRPARQGPGHRARCHLCGGHPGVGGGARDRGPRRQVGAVRVIGRPPPALVTSGLAPACRCRLPRRGPAVSCASWVNGHHGPHVPPPPAASIATASRTSWRFR